MKFSGEKITLAHGGGGYESGELLKEVFAAHFSNEVLGRLEDAAVLGIDIEKHIAVGTDTFVVRPLFFPGGDIGKLAVVGTVNDVLMSGAVPKYLTCGFVLEAGLPLETLDRVCASMAETAKEAGVEIVAGDTKVVEARTTNEDEDGAGLFINTTGIGVFEGAHPLPAPSGLLPGDRIIVSGQLGDHHACILSARMKMQNGIKSDCALLSPIVNALSEAGIYPHAMRDVTRGGLATVLNELAIASKAGIEIDAEAIPVAKETRAFCSLLGLDPLQMGNEGKMIFAVAEADADAALAAVRKTKIGENAALIGEVVSAGRSGATSASAEGLPSLAAPVVLRTALGGKARLDVLYGEGLPRIC